MTITIKQCLSIEQPGWLTLRATLWPECTPAQHRTEMSSLLADTDRNTQSIAYGAAGEPLGFVEASLRTGPVNGTDSSPVAFLEGIYVVPEFRRQGVATALVAAVTRWASAADCREFASDALLDNKLGRAFHVALGFEETERVVFYRKALL